MSTATLNIEKKKTLVPQLRFQEFDGEWKTIILGDLLTFKNGLNSEKEKYGKGVKFINVLDILNNDFITYDKIIGSVEVTEKEFEKNEVTYGDILFQRSSETRAEVGQANVYLDRNKSSVFGGFVIRGKAKSEYDPLFMNYLLRTPIARKEITDKSGGSTRYNVGQDTLSKVQLTTTIVLEQQKIASFLSAVDEKIQQLFRKKELLEQYKKGLMQQLFSGKLRFKDENGNDYADWEVKKLGEIAEKRIAKNRDNKITLVFTNSALHGIVNQRDFFDKDIANKNNLGGYYLVEKNDFVYNPRISTFAPVGPISRNHLDTGIMSPLYSVFRFKVGNLDFIDCFFNSSVWHLHMKDISNYGARDDRMSFSTGDFYKMPVPFPCIDEQQKIADFLFSIDVKIESANKQITQSQSFKKGLLQQMFV